MILLKEDISEGSGSEFGRRKRWDHPEPMSPGLPKTREGSPLFLNFCQIG